VKAAFVDLPSKVEAATCERVVLALVKGHANVINETLSQGDVLILTDPLATEVQGSGTAVIARITDATPCAQLARSAPGKTIVRATAAPALRWAGGAMSAHLDVETTVSPDLYVGRLEGTAPVAEHVHAKSWEILAAIEASGTFVLSGTERRLGAKQIVVVPPGAKHAWRPDPGSALVAIQMYAPPGPEQRFIALAAGDAGAGKDAGR
jgi:mannose-6-phosphate isomerase-like protein (cupin superfamily)